jgi:hypothetical protein
MAYGGVPEGGAMLKSATESTGSEHYERQNLALVERLIFTESQ